MDEAVQPFAARYLTSDEEAALLRSFLAQAEQQALAAYAGAVAEPDSAPLRREYSRRLAALDRLEAAIGSRATASRSAGGPCD